MTMSGPNPNPFQGLLEALRAEHPERLWSIAEHDIDPVSDPSPAPRPTGTRHDNAENS